MPNVAVIDRRTSARSSYAARLGSVPEGGWAYVRTVADGRGNRDERGSMWLVGNEPDEVSKADVELLGLLASGLPSPLVARTLAVSDRTVRRRVRAICDVIGVATAIEAVAWAARQRLI